MIASLQAGGAVTEQKIPEPESIKPARRTVTPVILSRGTATDRLVVKVGMLRRFAEDLDSLAMDADVGVATYALAGFTREAIQRLAMAVTAERGR